MIHLISKNLDDLSNIFHNKSQLLLHPREVIEFLHEKTKSLVPEIKKKSDKSEILVQLKNELVTYPQREI